MFEQPFVRNCPIQGIDPRLRLLAALVLSVLVALCQNTGAALAGLGLGALWLALAMAGGNPPLWALARRLLAVNAFVLLVWCTTPWATPGESLATLGPLALTREGMHLALLVTIKANALACVFVALVATLDVPSLTQALRFCRCPHAMVLLCVMALRNIHVLGAEWQRLVTAARLRGFTARAGLHGWRTLASLLALLLLRSLDRANSVCEAMLLRGFNGRLPAAAPRPLRLADAAFMLGVLAQGLALCWLEFWRPM